MKPTKIIYVACPWTPKGGGMFKVADYLVQSQSNAVRDGHAIFKPLDTRGGGNAVSSMFVLLGALLKVFIARVKGELSGVHVNMAERLSLFRKGFLILFCKLSGVPVVLHLHAAQLHHFYAKLPSPLQALTRYFFASATHCIVLGLVSKKFVHDELRVPLQKISIVINGVPKSTMARRSYDQTKPFRFLFLGNLSERKGVSDLLNAFALFKKNNIDREVILHIAGGGDVPYYQTLANRLSVIEFVHFEGWCDQQKASKLQADSDVLILPSYDEGLPLVILEALSAGVAVICTPVGEIPNVLTNGLNAAFVNPGDINQLAEEMMNLVMNETLRESLETNGKHIYDQEFSMEKFFMQVAQIHQNHFGVSVDFEGKS